jgi:cyclase
VPGQGEGLHPGGQVAGPGLVDEVLGYLRFVRDVAEQGGAAGVSPLELGQGTDLGRYTEWSDAERIVGNLHRAYADLAGPAEARGGPIDASGVLGDMVTYNGGRPLTCRA